MSASHFTCKNCLRHRSSHHPKEFPKTSHETLHTLIPNQHTNEYVALKVIVNAHREAKWHVMKVCLVRRVEYDGTPKVLLLHILLLPVGHIKFLNRLSPTD